MVVLLVVVGGVIDSVFAVGGGVVSGGVVSGVNVVAVYSVVEVVDGVAIGVAVFGCDGGFCSFSSWFCFCGCR